MSMLTTYYLIRKQFVVDNRQVEPALKGQLIWSTVLLVPTLWVTCWFALPEKFSMIVG